jgi:Xaa-Pro aminopeptidase
MECIRIRKCYLRDGVAISTFLAWLDNKLNSDDKCVDIYEAKSQLDYYRKLQEKFEISETSFIQRPSLNSPQSNSTSRRIQLDNNVYINSSGQYSDGTTRFISTYHFKNPSALDKQRYTRVLQAHIAINTLVFPRGTTGDIVDTIGRQALWKGGLDGDSSFIKNLHDENMDRIPLTAGMLLSNEPSSVFCVKNTVLVKQIDTPLCKNSHSLSFQHISFVPLCRRLIEVSLLSSEERYWINAYHKECFDHLSPQVDVKTLAWLLKETCPI